MIRSNEKGRGRTYTNKKTAAARKPAVARSSVAQTEQSRLRQDQRRLVHWKRWGPYLADRQWGTVREDYSADGDAWGYFPHDHARSRSYRWGEDGLLGISDHRGRLCFALALWNHQDPILKERLFGLTNPEGNHGEDVKEVYFHIDNTPTHSYMKALYKYPQTPFPYDQLVAENSRRGPDQPEYEITDTGAFAEDRYFDVMAEYAKAGPNDILIRITIANRGPDPARLDVMPTLWFRNTWSAGSPREACPIKPVLERIRDMAIQADHPALGRFYLEAQPVAGQSPPPLLFTENETNNQRLFAGQNACPFVKDAFHEYVVHGHHDVVNPDGVGTKAAVCYRLDIPPGESIVLRLRLFAEDEAPRSPFGRGFDQVFKARIAEADRFYRRVIPRELTNEQRNVARQAHAGLLWNKQFYYYIVKDWLAGDPNMPPPPASRMAGRNSDWGHLFSRDVISMPDKWEYPWFAAWDLAFHAVAFARIDAEFAKTQLLLLLREWYMHSDGRLPAYEFSFDDMNPPVHAWACWRVYQMTAEAGAGDVEFLSRAFHKLLLNYTWWTNRKDTAGKSLLAGGFLGLDHVGVFDRSAGLTPAGGPIEQTDATAWMAFFSRTMLSMALELARHNRAYEDMAGTFLEHFVQITDAMNGLGAGGLWDEHDGFYYDYLRSAGDTTHLRLRSSAGLVPLLAGGVVDGGAVNKLPGFAKRMRWFLENRRDLGGSISYMVPGRSNGRQCYLLAIPSRERLERVLRYVLDETELLSPFGLRSLSRVYRDNPYVVRVNGQEHLVRYEPAESSSRLFGGNASWRGPIWLPVNYLLVEALQQYHSFYGDEFKVECPTGSGRMMTLRQVAQELSSRLMRTYLPDAGGLRPALANVPRFADDPHWHDWMWFFEYFDGDTGRGAGASHQTGWTALVARLLEEGRRASTSQEALQPQPAGRKQPRRRRAKQPAKPQARAGKKPPSPRMTTPAPAPSPRRSRARRPAGARR